VWWEFSVLRGTRFGLTVIEADLELAGAPAVEGMRVRTMSHATVKLSAEQVAELGLPPGAYDIHGMVRRGDSDLVELPDLQTLRGRRPLATPPRRTTPRTQHGETGQSS
jgi:hypothetical protein